MTQWKKDKLKNIEKYHKLRSKNRSMIRFYDFKVRKLKSKIIKTGNWTFDIEDFKL